MQDLAGRLEVIEAKLKRKTKYHALPFWLQKGAETKDQNGPEPQPETFRILILWEVTVNFTSVENADKGDGIAVNSEAESVIAGSDTEI